MNDNVDTVLEWFGDLIFKNIVRAFFFHLGINVKIPDE